MPFIKDNFPTCNDYGNASIEEVYGKDHLKEGVELTATTFASMVLYNKAGSKFEAQSLPKLAQISPVNAIIPLDFNGDGMADLIMAGNNYDTEVETPRYDAGNGLLLLGDGKGVFNPLSWRESGVFAPGNAKDIAILTLAGTRGRLLLVANNNSPLQAFLFPGGKGPI